MNNVWKDKKCQYLIGSSKEAFLRENLLAEIFDKGKSLSKSQSYGYINDVCLKKSLGSKRLGT